MTAERKLIVNLVQEHTRNLVGLVNEIDSQLSRLDYDDDVEDVLEDTLTLLEDIWKEYRDARNMANRISAIYSLRE